MSIPISGNPHGKPPYRDLWEKGWRLERKKDDLSQVKGKRPPFRNEPATPRQNFPKRYDRAPLPTAANTANTGRYEASKPQQSQTPKEVKSVLTDRMVNRFNQRHKTTY